ncbi:recombination regulator RecX [Legionella shakespearei]|uniref:Regulatory protein RecX n=1 Tax=Legionella shakespearei DSM 23087 TaxID=1122169 RepID=A0A0W0YLA6_9GAMM|nr:recombination regulator RecX [Legionella shakespearei]KTD57713.1 Regulatory protein RecX [Legionella shakespearei DSM 23087]
MTKAMDSALRLLTRREHGAIELCDKLKQKGFSYVEAKEAVEECQRLGLQSDSRFVEAYSRSRIRQGYGPLKITQDLKAKGIDSDLIHRELAQEGENWISYAMDVWQKKCKGQTDLSFIEIQKQQRFLLYRGFGMDTITAVVKEMK